MQTQEGLQNKYSKLTKSEITIKNTHLAVGVGIIFGCGVAAGWLLSYWGFFFVR